MVSPFPCGSWGFMGPVDGACDVLRDRRSELNEFTSRAFEREAMLVLPARRVRSQCWNADAVLPLDGLRAPGARGTVHLRRDPALDGPAMDRGIFLFLAKFDHFVHQTSRAGIAARE